MKSRLLFSRSARWSALAVAACLCSVGSNALANGSGGWSGVSFDDEVERHWGDSFQSRSEPVRLEYHVEREFSDGSGQRERFVAVVDPRQAGWVAQWFSQAASAYGGAENHGSSSWDEALNRDWAGRFRTRWGQNEGRHHGGGVQAWWERYNMHAVPEPSSWALMLAGLAGIGLSLRVSAPGRKPGARA